MNVEEGPKGVRSPLLQRLIATASSMTMSEHAAQLLLALNTDAAASGDKPNLFLCEGGMFPGILPIRVADELLVYQHFKVKEMNDRFV
jgi:DNA mismatch repair protein MSH3